MPRLPRRPRLGLIAGLLVVGALLTLGYFGQRSGWGTLRIRTTPSTQESGPTTTTVPTTTTRTEAERAADERFAAAGSAPITPAEQGVVDLRGTRDFTAPGLGIPSVTCQGQRARVVVSADDNERVATVVGTFTPNGGAPQALTFTAAGGQWVASIETTPGTADAVSIVARDNAGNTLTRTLTNLCA